MKQTIFTILCAFFLFACSSPQPGPDKTIGGAVLGAGWGAGAGAIVGNQISYAGEGAAVGAGFGAVEGAMTGMGHDLTESELLRQKRELESLEVQNAANRQKILALQDKLDRALVTHLPVGVYQVFFDADVTSLRAGAIANLEAIAESLKTNPHGFTINVVGNTDDTGDPKYNKRLAEARARSVSSYLAARGISSDRLQVESHGSKRPIASNATPEGRQLNRRVDIFLSR